jgi:hypothetical protein
MEPVLVYPELVEGWVFVELALRSEATDGSHSCASCEPIEPLLSFILEMVYFRKNNS